MTAAATAWPIDIAHDTSSSCRKISRGLSRYQRKSGLSFASAIFGEPTTISNYDPIHTNESTTANITGQINLIPTKTTAGAILEIRRRSGLTWDELSEVFDVSRRSVHLWANGKGVSARNERVIRQTLAAIRHLDEGSQIETRARLLSIDIAGLSPFDFLTRQKFKKAMALPSGETKPIHHHSPLSPQTLETQRPPALVSLLAANQKRFDSPDSKARLARSIRTAKKKK